MKRLKSRKFDWYLAYFDGRDVYTFLKLKSSNNAKENRKLILEKLNDIGEVDASAKFKSFFVVYDDAYLEFRNSECDDFILYKARVPMDDADE